MRASQVLSKLSQPIGNAGQGAATSVSAEQWSLPSLRQYGAGITGAVLAFWHRSTRPTAILRRGTIQRISPRGGTMRVRISLGGTIMVGLLLGCTPPDR